MLIDLTPCGHVTTRGRLIAASPDVVIVDTSYGLALCDNPMTDNPFSSLVGDADVLQACPHGLRGIVRAYMRRHARVAG